MSCSLRILGAGLALVWVFLLLGPLLLLGESLRGPALLDGLSDPRFATALGLSLQTSVVSLLLTVLLGTPVAWYLARRSGGWAKHLEPLLELPVVIPPAVVGVALLMAFGRQGSLGALLFDLGLELPFSKKGVVLAQLVVSSPFYVQGAKTAFSKVSSQHLEVAQTLGAGPAQRFWHVAVPIAWPGLVSAASIAWARALGEFGATLLFAGNRVGHTQTMPLAIFSAMESNVALAVVFSLALAALGLLALSSLRWLGSKKGRRSA